jgi:two-component sensor histidine kinase
VSKRHIFSVGEITDRPSARVYRAVVTAIGLYVFAAICVIPFAATQTPIIPATIPFVVATILATDLSSGFLLFVMAVETRKLSFIVLGCAYLYAGLMAVLQLLMFPDVVVRHGVALGKLDSGAWVFSLWMAGFALISFASILYETAFPDRQLVRGKAALAVGITLTLLLVTGIGVATTVFIEAMPPLMRGMAWNQTLQEVLLATSITQAVAAGLCLLVAGRRNRVFLWLNLALVAMMIVNGLTLAGGANYTVGWSLARASWVFSSYVLFLFFMGQFAVQLRLLARAKGTLEHSVQERTAELTEALNQRDLLLREVYHRVKNNLQVIDSMLFLERGRCSDAATQAMIDMLRRRFFALGLVHQQLMASADMKHFDIAPFLHELIRNLGIATAVQELGISLTVKSETIPVTLDTAIPLGLLTTELVTNSIRHAKAEHIAVSFHRDGDGQGHLVVADDGTNSDAVTFPSQLATGQGSLIVAGLVDQLDGRLCITHDDGWQVAIMLPLPEE